MPNLMPASDMPAVLPGKARLMTTLRKSRWAVLVLSILMVGVLRLSTPVTRPANDGQEYLKVASEGLDPQAQLAAPFCYRFAVPMIVHGVSVLTGADPVLIFPYVALLSCIGLLMASYVVAQLAGASRGSAFLTMLLMAGSLFIVRFPLYFPYSVDVEALLISFLACVLLLRHSYIAALIVSLVGLLFKEFLLVPLIVLVGLFFIQYLRNRTTRPLLWTILSLALTILVFLLPRLLISVTYSYGTNLQVKASAPTSSMYLAELRRFIAWPPEIGTFVNVLLAFASFWLPALMLFTPARVRSLWRSPGADRTLVVVWMGMVVALASVGGTNIMIFVIYSAPILVLVLSVLFRSGVSKAEATAVVVATLLFNRMIFGFGTPGGELDAAIRFYGAYWHLLDGTTAWRFAELTGWVLLGWGIRRVFSAASILSTPVQTQAEEIEVVPERLR